MSWRRRAISVGLFLMPEINQENLRNVAIIAHVDHGKTSLVDAMLKFSKVFRDNQDVGELILDSNPLERERGITILAKNTGITYRDLKINIIDTPGHVDFSGEVERVVNMADGCLLVVDAVEGPMPQTRSVLRTALASGLRPVVVITKIDRPTSRINEVEQEVQDLFLQLATDAEQLDYPVLYTSAREGFAVARPGDAPHDMDPLFAAIVDHIPPPQADPSGPLQLLVAALTYDSHLGQVAIGRLFRGRVRRGDLVARMSADGSATPYRINGVYLFENLQRREVEEAVAGDIVAVAGVQGVSIGDTVAAADVPEALPRIDVEQPTVEMTFGVNTSPLAGRDGQYATSRMLMARLQRELQTDVALRVEPTDSADEFVVAGRGELHLAILIENIRREGFEIQVSKPEAVRRIVDGRPQEPYERLSIETRDEYMGVLTEELSTRLAMMTDMRQDRDGGVKLEFELPTRGLIGFRSFFLRAARGDGLMNSEFVGLRPVAGMVRSTRPGALVASEPGITSTYGLLNAQDRGSTFLESGIQVYEGMVVGLNSRDSDLNLNVCKERKQTNMRSANSEITQKLSPAFKPTLEEGLDLIAFDELLEVTPKSLRLRKRTLSADARHRENRGRAQSA
jgi:GTP-binding protein